MPTSKPKKPVDPTPALPPDAATAFAALKTELAALEPSELAPINIDIPHAVSLVLGVLPGIEALRPAIVHDLPHHPIALLDKLETYALAAWYAHLLALPAAGAASPVKSLLDEATTLRAALLGDAETLARRGLFESTAVAAIRSGQGNVDTANDLVALASLFTARWSAVEHKTAASAEEVARAGHLGPLLLAALGVRAHGEAAPAEAADQRARAFTLFMRAYDATRRAVQYLRWDEDDADTLAPSLYKGRGGRGGRAAPAGAPAQVRVAAESGAAPEPRA